MACKKCFFNDKSNYGSGFNLITGENFFLSLDKACNFNFRILYRSVMGENLTRLLNEF